jgi:hypothetical protein
MKELSRNLYPHEVSKHRREGCSNYDDCLNVAAKKNMKSFSCDGCEEFHAREGSPEAFMTTIEHAVFPDHECNEEGETYMNWADFRTKLLNSMRKLGIPVQERR